MIIGKELRMEAGLRPAPMAIWKRFWILFTAIWVFVALLNLVTIFAFAEEIEPDRVLTLLGIAAGVPALFYAAGWLWERLRRGTPPPA
jgi:hypothetical protein